MSSGKDLVRALTKSQKAEADVELYTLRNRIDALYFGILLLEEKFGFWTRRIPC